MNYLQRQTSKAVIGWAIVGSLVGGVTGCAHREPNILPAQQALETTSLQNRSMADDAAEIESLIRQKIAKEDAAHRQ